ncbi:MAG: tetratricopeptide repeat protein [Planctomycetota bacterium]|jgi:tetratricopeptide (TPR) repeat protein
MTDIAETMQVAMQHHQAGRLQQAEQLYSLILQSNPNHSAALHSMGLIAYQTNRYEVAVDLVDRAIAANPKIPEYHNTMGAVFKVLGKLEEAINAYQRAILLKPNYVNVYNNLGVALRAKGRYVEAVANYKQAIQLEPAFTDAYYNLANVLRDQGQYDQAVENYRQVIRLTPDFARAYNNLGITLKELGRGAEAIESYQRAIQLEPNYTEAYNKMAVTLLLQEKYDAAIEKCEQAVQLDPDYAEAYNTMASAMHMQGRYAEAIEKYSRTLQLRPDYAEAHSNLAIILLLTGDFEQGWKKYQWRLNTNINTRRHRFEQLLWDGSSFAGKRLFVYYEQGFGDTLQFIRYLPMVKARGGTVIFEERKPLLGLLRGFGGIDELVEDCPGSRPDIKFDFHVPLLNLPMIFGTTLQTIPPEVPYLYADSAKLEYWQDRLSRENFKVGVAWAGSNVHKNDRNRSCTPENFASLAAIDGVKLYGLQKGPAAVQLENSPQETVITNLGEQFEDFTDTAAAIENLDLVISVDTAVLHLAGAMGKPTWALLPFAPDWRWLLDRQDSPWYPTMKLFRQAEPCDWDNVFESVTQQLKKMVVKQSVQS